MCYDHDDDNDDDDVDDDDHDDDDDVPPMSKVEGLPSVYLGVYIGCTWNCTKSPSRIATVASSAAEAGVTPTMGNLASTAASSIER